MSNVEIKQKIKEVLVGLSSYDITHVLLSLITELKKECVYGISQPIKLLELVRTKVDGVWVDELVNA